MLRDAFLTLSHNTAVRNLATGLPPARRFSRRFVAGETLDDAIAVVRAMNQAGVLATLDYLGENVTNPAAARAYAEEYIGILDRIQREQVKSNVSLKLTGLGLDLSTDLAFENVRRVVSIARTHDNFVRIDMESSDYTDRTLAIYRRLRDVGFDNVGVVIQAYLYRSEADINALIRRGGANIRLCKGAYDEPEYLAFPRKADTDANFVHLMQLLLSPEARQQGTYAAIATHDDAMITTTQAYAAEQDLDRQAYEFQMLHGIRTNAQLALVRDGYKMRVYVPYGSHWYPYFMRRLAERPANMLFLLRNLVR